jgi:hypothetical protein
MRTHFLEDTKRTNTWAMGDADWDAFTRAPNPKHERLPHRDVAVKDGDTITHRARSAWISRRGHFRRAMFA